jgi:hypothetical protein
LQQALRLVFNKYLDSRAEVDDARYFGLRLIGLAFAIITLVVIGTTAAVVASVDPDQLGMQSTLK